jgi:hypothetical protein
MEDPVPYPKSLIIHGDRKLVIKADGSLMGN